MSKKINKLSALKVKSITESGWYSDGRGLYLQVSKTGTKSWVYRYQIDGRERRCGLGSFLDVSLEQARRSAEACRQLRLENIDPIEHKRQLASQRRSDEAFAVTFKECAIAYINSHKAGWKNPKHEMYWRNTLETYSFPTIGNMSVNEIQTQQVLKVLEPIWMSKTETATRVRQRIENILDWAKVRGYRGGENPALWRGHLDKLLPKRVKIQKVRHFPAMPYLELPEYFQKLRNTETLAAKALAFIILNASRVGEVKAAKYSEVSLQDAVWTIPEERMKAHREHRVPLCAESIQIVKELQNYRVDDYLFPSIKKGKNISDAAILKLLKQDYPNLTVHGFRSTFRDWCAEMTNYPRELAESALAHVLKDQTEAAYQRGDLLLKRRKLMESWASYCIEKKNEGNVLTLNKKKGMLND